MAKKLDMKFQIKGVEVLNIELTQPPKKLPAKVTFNFNVSIKHKINPQKKIVLVLVGVNMFHENKENLLGKILVNCVYLIENFDEIVQEKESQKFYFTKEITDLLNSISISTTRGVMASVFRGTVLHNAILPVINPQDFNKHKTNAESK